MRENICHFIPFHKDVHSIHTINFVLETKQQQSDRLKLESVYKMYYVCSGKGFIHTLGKVIPLSQGDIFFTFPATSFAIESVENFTYMYISFVGIRGNMIMDNLNINNRNFVFHNVDEVQDFWEKGILTSSKALELISESVLLYSFSVLSNMILTDHHKSIQPQSIDLIKKYVDDHFTEHDFSINKMSQDLSYNYKYISHVFKKQTGIGIIEYLNTIRIQNACTIMEQGFTSISDIAYTCGYSDSQYFSKIFKGKMGMAPSQYIKTIKEKARS